MQEAKRGKAITNAVDAAGRWVAFFIEGSVYSTSGDWHWPMQSEAVFCSDVMAGWPASFTGTKSIVHPDDKERLLAFIQKLQAGHSADIHFQIITTYGDVKDIRGTGIQIAELEEPIPFEPETETFTQTKETDAVKRAAENAAVQKTGFDYAERLTKTGTWHTVRSTGKTWYSDGLFRLLGLAPQSINVHPNTLNSFIHPEDHKDVVDAFQQALERGVPLHLRFRIVQAGGNEKWVEQTTAWGYSERGETMLQGVIADVTAVKEEEQKSGGYEAAASFQKQLLHFAESATSTGYWQINLLTKKTVYSDNFYRLFGLKPNVVQVASSFLINYIHPDDRDLYESVQQKIRKEHTVPEIDYRILRPDGKLRYIRQKGKAIISGDEILMVGTVQDITVQKTLEKKLAEQQETLEVKTVTGQQSEAMASTGSWLWNIKTGDIEWSENFYELLGQKPQNITLTRKLLLRSIHADDQKLFTEQLELTVKEKTPVNFTFRIIRRSELRHLKASFRFLNHQENDFLIATVQDVTVEQQALLSLITRIQLVEQLADTIPDQVMVTDADNNILLWNKKCEQVYKLKREKVIGQNFFDVLTPLKQEPILKRLALVMSGEEVRLYAEPGRYILRGYFDMTHIPLKVAGGVSGILHLVHDVTEQRNLHQQLNSRLQFIERLLEVSADRIVALDRNMNYLYWNKKAEEEFGLSKEEVIGKNILEVFPGTNPQLSYADFRKALYGETVFHPATEELKTEMHLIPVKDDAGEVTAVLWVQHDRSKEFFIEKQSQKALDIINALNENYLELDYEYRVIFVNRQTLDYLGKSEEEVSGKLLWEIYPQIIDTPLHIAFVHAMEERVVVRQEFKSPLYSIELLVSIAPTPDGIAVTFSDISFIKKAEQALAEEHRRLNEAQALGHVGSFEWKVGAKTSQWSNELYRINGLEPQSEEATLEKTHEFIHPDDRAEFERQKQLSIEKPGRYTYQHRIVHRDGKLRWVNQQWESLADEQGNVVRVKGVVHDMTEQKKAEQKIDGIREQLVQRVTNKYLTLFNSIDEGFLLGRVVHDGNGTIDFAYEDVNPAYERIVGISKEELIGRTARQVLPDLGEEWYEAVRKVGINREATIVESFVTPIAKWLNAHYTPFGAAEEGWLAIVFNDVTERKKTEERQKFLLALSDALRPLSHPVDIQEAVAQTAMDFFEADRCYYCEIENGDIIIRREAATGVLPAVAGVYPLTNFPILKAVVDAGYPLVVEDVHSTNMVDEELRQLCIQLHIISFINVPVIKNGKAVGILCLVQSKPRNWISIEVELAAETAERTWSAVERARAEEALHHSEEKYRGYLEREVQSRTAFAQTIVDASIDQMTIFDKNERFLAWNRKAEETGGLKREDVIGKTISEVFPNIGEEPEFLVAQKKALAGEYVYIPAKRGIYSKNYQQWFYVPLKDEAGETYAVLNIIHDITDKVEAEEVLKQKARELESKNEEITNFAFIASHDLKEPLRKIHTFSNWLMEKEADGLSIKGKEFVFKIAAAVKRLDTLIEDITTLTKLDAIKEMVEEVDLNAVVKMATTELEAEIEETNAVVEAGDLPILTGHKKQIIHLFKNIINNAVKFQEPDVMPVLEIKAMTVESPANLPPGTYWRISFTDNGIGFDSEYAEKIFKVFQRLHGQNQYTGTGIGLAICKKIMENHRGAITAESKAGQGAVFTCYFPM